MENYTLGLALFDYLPVIAAGFGLYLICKYCASLAGYRGYWIVAVPAIALTGGVLKASWKLIWALQAVNVYWMSEQLFFFLATAYVLMASLVVMSLRAAGKQTTLARNWWTVPAVIVVIVLAAAVYLRLNIDGRGWSLLLLATLSLANLVMLIALIVHAVRRRNILAAAAFASILVLSYILVALARIPEQTAELQWIEEILNLGNNSMLAIGAWLLIQAQRSREATDD